jgi:hypothetical protein
MMRLIDLRGQRLSKSGYNNAIPRAALDVAEAMKLVEPILARVKNGDESDLIALAKFQQSESKLFTTTKDATKLLQKLLMVELLLSDGCQ